MADSVGSVGSFDNPVGSEELLSDSVGSFDNPVGSEENPLNYRENPLNLTRPNENPLEGTH